MGLESLHDLRLSGVKWELQEGASPIIAHQSAAPAMAAVTGGAPAVDAVVPVKTIVPPIAPLNPTASEGAACTAAAGAADWESLCTIIGEFTAHPLCAFAKNAVPPQGRQSDAGKRLVVITDTISADDEGAGRILSGAPGDLFDKMMTAIGLSRDNLDIIPLIFWRTPGGRTPTADEIGIARPFVKRAVDLAAPDAILTLGTTAALEIADIHLGRTCGDAVTTTRFGPEIPVFPIFHPNYLVLKPDAKKQVWDMLKKLQAVLFA